MGRRITAIVIWVALAVAGIPTAAAAPPNSTIALTLTSVTPVVAQPGEDVVVSVTVTNTGPDPADIPAVTLRRGTASATSRDQVRAWANSTEPATGLVLAQSAGPTSLAAGGSAQFTMTVPDPSALTKAPYGVLPIAVEAGDRSLHTFLAVNRTKEYQPLGVSILVPLTPSADPDLLSLDRATSDTAWDQAVAPDSRLARLVETTESLPVTWAIDPSLLAPPEDPESSEASARTDFAQRLRDSTRDRVILPRDDADLGAEPSDAARTMLTAAVTAASSAAADLDAPLAFWPVDGVISPRRIATWQRLGYAPERDLLIGASTTWTPSARTPPGVASAADDAGPVLSYDAEMSMHLSAAASGDGVLLGQFLVAEATAILDEAPGTARQLILATPRDAAPDGSAFTQALAALAATPWLTLESATTAASQKPVRASTADNPGVSPAEPRAALATQVTPAHATDLASAAAGVSKVSSFRADGEALSASAKRVVDHLLSTAWRDHPEAWNAAYRAIKDTVRTSLHGFSVVPQDITFLADTGRIQITVTNDLDVDVHDIAVSITAGNPSLRVTEPTKTVDIGAHSRARVTVAAQALASGSVPITTTLSAPDGTVLASSSAVQVRVTPTGAWVYWAIAGIALVALVLGLWRGRRRRSTATTGPASPVNAE